jgi:6,7-dimethyl-8-ribityllumazine synthase
MLKPVQRRRAKAVRGKYVIIASRYNSRFVDPMLKAAKAELLSAGANEVELIRVPGAFEIPVVAARVARAQSASVRAILCLGVILRGETTHAQHIGEAVSSALMEIQTRCEVPVIHEVLLLESPEQARARCLDPKSNRGREAAQTALEMARVMNGLDGPLEP